MRGGERKCALCGVEAKARCESDKADLCWECDAEVHGANFLVARHTRRLLCRRCHRPTPWRADGPRLGPSVSVCLACFDDAGKKKEMKDRRPGGADVDGQIQVVPHVVALPASTGGRGESKGPCSR